MKPENAAEFSSSAACFSKLLLAKNLRLQPAKKLQVHHPCSALGQNILAIHSRLGNLMAALAGQVGIPVESALAVWLVESGPYRFEPGRPLLRFEVHKFWQHWGNFHPDVFNHHFQFGGNGGISGSSWSNHRYFDAQSNSWHAFHGDQAKEYEALEIACSLADREKACLSSSFGGPQILGSNHARLGYDSAEDLFKAFGKSERWQVCGFFDFCQSHGLLEALRNREWHQFAKIYNGPGQADVYAERINDAYQASVALLQNMPELIETFDHQAFQRFFGSLGIKNFKAHEFLFKGRFHSTVGHPAYGLNSLPPPELWPNIGELAKLVDRLRTKINAPITLSSIYRTGPYNAAVGGNPESRHLKFSAVDFRIKNDLEPKGWCEMLRKLRSESLFTGCIGLHDDAVHLDIRSENVDF